MEYRSPDTADTVPLSDRDLVEEIVLALVEHPEAVRVMAVEIEAGVSQLTIHVDPRDRGQVVGRQGTTMRILRMLLARVAMSTPSRRRRIYIDLSPLPRDQHVKQPDDRPDARTAGRRSSTARADQ